jgi:CubicO group peptidase (beta-lactamase class C family)
MTNLRSLMMALFTVTVQAAEPIQLSALEQDIADETLKNITSVLVQHKQQLIYEHYFNEHHAQSQHDMRSASKSITSMAVGLAIADGLIKDVQQPVMSYFKDKQPVANPDPRKMHISIEDLLTMSSVLECDDWNSASRGNEERMYIIEDWSQFILDLPVRGIPPWKKKPEDSPWGRTFSYCTGGVQVLAELIERVTKQPMSDYLQSQLFAPLNIQPPQFSQSPLGHTNGGGGMRMTSRNWITIGQLMLSDGRHQGQQLIPAKWVAESFKPRAMIDEARKMSYGYLWWINQFDVNGQTLTAYAAAGNGGNYLFILPSLDASVVITSTAYNTPYMHQQSRAILTDHVLPALLRVQ